MKGRYRSNLAEGLRNFRLSLFILGERQDFLSSARPRDYGGVVPRTEAGNAIADLLYGDVAPSGKLPMSFPRAVGQEPLYYNQFPTGRPPVGFDLTKPPTFDSRFFSRYIDVPNDALFSFGFGLSYTQFAYEDVAVSRKAVPFGEASRRDARDLVTVTARSFVPVAPSVAPSERGPGRPVRPPRTVRFQAGHIPSWRESCAVAGR